MGSKVDLGKCKVLFVMVEVRTTLPGMYQEPMAQFTEKRGDVNSW